jgi:hypothetical protein
MAFAHLHLSPLCGSLLRGPSHSGLPPRPLTPSSYLLKSFHLSPTLRAPLLQGSQLTKFSPTQEGQKGGDRSSSEASMTWEKSQNPSCPGPCI